MAWTCPDCDRRFGAVGRSHICTPGVSIEEFLARSLPQAEPVLRVLEDHLGALDGDLIVDPLGQKVLFKNGPTFAILETKKKWLALGFTLRRRLESERLSRKVVRQGSGFWHVVNLAQADEVDDELLEWLTEAFHRREPTAAEAMTSTPGDMVPEDVDDPFR